MTQVSTILVETNYTATEVDYYIGVDSKKAVTITLPPVPNDGKIIVIKAEMKPPIGNRKITIEASDGSSIDGYSNHVIHVSNECVHLIYRGHSWHVI